MTEKRDKSRRKKQSFSDIESISIAGLSAEMGPVALHLYANSFLVAALALPEQRVPFDPVKPYLVCHSIELALKAFLSLKGSAMADLADGPYGHRLDVILMKAEEAGLAKLVKLTVQKKFQIRRATHYYCGKAFEYPAVGEAISGYPSMPDLPMLIDTAKLLVEQLREPCK